MIDYKTREFITSLTNRVH